MKYLHEGYVGILERSIFLRGFSLNRRSEYANIEPLRGLSVPKREEIIFSDSLEGKMSG